MHQSDESCIAEEMLDRLMPLLLRSGSVRPALLLELAEQLDREIDTASVEREAELERMVTALRTWVIEAEGPTQSEWQAERLRKRFNVVPMKPVE